MSISAHVGSWGDTVRRGPRVQLDRAVVGRPREGAGTVEHEVVLGLVGVGVLVVPAWDPLRARGRRLLLPEALRAGAVGVAVQVDGAVVQVRQHHRRHDGVVADEVPLGQRPPAAGRREQHLVEVRQLHDVPTDRPLTLAPEGVERGQLVGGRGSPLGATHPGRRRRRLHLVVGAPALHRAGMVLGVPARLGVTRRACGAAASPRLAPPPRPHQHEPTAQLLAVQVEVQLAGLDGGERVLALGRRPRAPVPDDDVTAAVLAVGDEALEVEVARTGGPRRGRPCACTSGSSVGPFGTAQLTRTPPASRRKS